MNVDPIAIVRYFYGPHSRLYSILLSHSEAVAEKSLRLARSLGESGVDTVFLEEAALLHDIGIIRVKPFAPEDAAAPPYVCHGVLGRQMLEGLDLPRHGLVCERHVGTGLTVEEIVAQQLPLPVRDMRPVSLEEKIVAYADKFFSKKEAGGGAREKPMAEVVQELGKYGSRQVEIFLAWAGFFGEAPDGNTGGLPGD